MKTRMKARTRLQSVILMLILSVYAINYTFAQVPLVFDVENRGSSCTKPTPKLQTSNKAFPDPFQWSSGTGRVSTCDEWSCRRNEIKTEIEYYEIGAKPNPPANVTATYSGGTLTVKVTENGQTLTLTSSFTVPSGTGPFPVMIGMGGFGGIQDQLTGIIQLTFNHDQVVTYNAGSGSRNLNDPFYKLYPNLTTSGKYCGWSWGVSRLIDGLAICKAAGTLNVDMTKIGVVGCSYAGKMALFSGAFDERIALTIAEESGGGGINGWRTSKEFNLRTGTNIEKIDNTNYSWFMESMKTLDPYTLPHDHHELVAMVAPRAFLSLGNPDMVWLCDESGYKTLRAAHEVWKAFGVADRFGFDFEANHSHCSAPAVQKANAKKFIDKFMRGITSTNTTLTSNPFGNVDYQSFIPWTTPTITCAPADPDIPSVTITAPLAGATAETGATVTISATVTDAGNNVSKVEFLVDGVKIGEDLTAPYTFTWTATTKGSHTITAKATDALAKTGSAEAVITITVPQTPYLGTPWPIPGKIEFENYDEGGNNVAYYDSSPGTSVPTPPNFRSSEDVDIETCTDAGTGYNLGYTVAGEWLEYTVNVAAAGTYNLVLRVACSGTGRTISITAKDVSIANNLAIPNTGGWQTWQDLAVNNITLTAGVQIIRVTIGATDYVNLNYMTFSTLTPVTPAPTVVSPVSYCQGATATALTATGTALKWYTTATGGTASTTAPTPSTTTVGSTIYYVTQTLNSVESARAAITVNVTATPTAPTVSTPVNYTVGQTASALTATGTGLKWYTVATGGTSSTTAPTPSTTTAGTTNYYVSQTTGSCESPRALIAVVVTSSNIPTVSLKAGWNLIGCPIDGSTNIANALSSVWSQVESVKNSDSYWHASNTIPGLNTLLKLDWGQGYLIKVKTNCELDWIVR